MSGKSHTVSVRLSQEDYDFLASSNWQNASTLSEKVRELIIQARLHDTISNTHVALHNSYTEYLQALLQQVQSLEQNENIHSEVLQTLLLTLPQLTAALPQDTSLSATHLKNTETDLTELIFRCFSNLLRLAITEKGPSYDPDITVRHLRALQPTLETLLSLPHIKTV
ncbi:hypothetical protein [Aliamphritea ceti]|uniref:hypothetical protein n=1 Tax=Aliamphritea ceti TaxID=1524258 RepID=UPI0021C35A5C|nr:hypothetical protein [Aliamphritea ceti]